MARRGPFHASPRHLGSGTRTAGVACRRHQAAVRAPMIYCLPTTLMLRLTFKHMPRRLALSSTLTLALPAAAPPSAPAHGRAQAPRALHTLLGAPALEPRGEPRGTAADQPVPPLPQAGEDDLRQLAPWQQSCSSSLVLGLVLGLVQELVQELALIAWVYSCGRQQLSKLQVLAPRAQCR